MATWAGQNVGAGKIDRVREGVRYAGIMGVLYSILAFAVLFFFGEQISLLFVDPGETEILHQAWMFLVGNSMFYIALVCEMVGRSAVGFILVPIFGYSAACIGSPAAWILADMFLIPAFYYCLKRLKGKMAGQNGE